MAGPPVRTDIVDVYVYRQAGAGTRRNCQFLQMRRRAGTLAGSWQPVMGHIEEGETASQAATRELAEETGWALQTNNASVLGFWQLEEVNTYFLHRLNCIMMSPCFAVEVTATSEPTLDESHDSHRWILRDQVQACFAWPGQRTAVAAILRDLLSAQLSVADHLSIEP